MCELFLFSSSRFFLTERRRILYITANLEKISERAKFSFFFICFIELIDQVFFCNFFCIKIKGKATMRLDTRPKTSLRIIKNIKEFFYFLLESFIPIQWLYPYKKIPTATGSVLSGKIRFYNLAIFRLLLLPSSTIIVDIHLIVKCLNSCNLSIGNFILFRCV